MMISKQDFSLMEQRNPMNPEQARKLSQLIARCWADDDFKRRLLADPAPILQAEGLALPPGGLSIPAKPMELIEENLEFASEVRRPACAICNLCAWSYYNVPKQARSGPVATETS